MEKTLNRTVLTSPVHFLAFGFGSGLSPKAPGTMGTLAAIPLYLLLMNLPLTGYLLAVLLISVAGIWICGESSRRLGVHDHGGIVWDEFAGFLLTMTAAPQGWAWIVLGFALFRLFDIWKPWPVRVADRQLHGRSERWQRFGYECAKIQLQGSGLSGPGACAGRQLR